MHGRSSSATKVLLLANVALIAVRLASMQPTPRIRYRLLRSIQARIRQVTFIVLQGRSLSTHTAPPSRTSYTVYLHPDLLLPHLVMMMSRRLSGTKLLTTFLHSALQTGGLLQIIPLGFLATLLETTASAQLSHYTVILFSRLDLNHWTCILPLPTTSSLTVRIPDIMEEECTNNNHKVRFTRL